ncbi:hypothetical protein [Actinotalea sp. C106]|uniref:hypothetical protein n=1 Tax=Actinotalea sp. C106 TaxID=2908644 RepID=UPI002028E445|nr:hypothetical protein [Actinotalea sp. C106]
MTTHEARDRRRYALERELAPHVEETWAEAFILELRLRGVPGPRIADALVEADSHCAESGTPASEAFGDAVEYAASLELPTADEPVGQRLHDVLPMALQVVAVLAATWSMVDARQGGAVEITVGAVVAAVLLAGECAFLSVLVERFFRTVVEHPVRTWFVAMANMGVLVLLMLALDGVIAAVPARPVLAGSLVLMLVGAVWQARHNGTDVEEDLLVAPLATPTALQPSRAHAMALRLQPWFLPVVVLVLTAVFWVLG